MKELNDAIKIVKRMGYMYRTLAIITRGFYYFSVFSHVSFSLMFGSIPMKHGGYKTRKVIIRARLMMVSIRYSIEI